MFFKSKEVKLSISAIVLLIVIVILKLIKSRIAQKNIQKLCFLVIDN